MSCFASCTAPIYETKEQNTELLMGHRNHQKLAARAAQGDEGRQRRQHRQSAAVSSFLPDSSLQSRAATLPCCARRLNALRATTTLWDDLLAF